MLLTKELLSKIKRIQIKTDRMASEILVGEYKSAFKGRGLNFDSIREYQPGDDIRLIDWKVTARMGDPFMRQYKEERQISIMLLLDLSASNNFGTCEKSKKDLATELSAILASLAIKNNDKVGLIIFTDQIELYVPPKQGKAHVFRIIKDLTTFKPKSQGTNFKEVLSSAMSMIPRNAVVFFISDFLPNRDGDSVVKFQSNGGHTRQDRVVLDFEKELKVMNKAQDLVALSIRDPREFYLPNIGFMEIWDPETGNKELLNLNRKSTRDKYKKVQEGFFSALKDKFRSMGIDFMDLRTNKSYTTQLLSFFLQRERRN